MAYYYYVSTIANLIYRPIADMLYALNESLDKSSSR